MAGPEDLQAAERRLPPLATLPPIVGNAREIGQQRNQEGSNARFHEKQARQMGEYLAHGQSQMRETNFDKMISGLKSFDPKIKADAVAAYTSHVEHAQKNMGLLREMAGSPYRDIREFATQQIRNGADLRVQGDLDHLKEKMVAAKVEVPHIKGAAPDIKQGATQRSYQGYPHDTPVEDPHAKQAAAHGQKVAGAPPAKADPTHVKKGGGMIANFLRGFGGGH